MKVQIKGHTIQIDKEDLHLVNDYCWSYNSVSGYIQGWQKGKTVYLHRMITNAPYGLDVDHINHNRSDNRRSNLRVVTRQQNKQNSKHALSNTGLKGIVKRPNNKFLVRIYKDRRCYNIGTFKNMFSAIMAYNKASEKYHGEHGIRHGFLSAIRQGFML